MYTTFTFHHAELYAIDSHKWFLVLSVDRHAFIGCLGLFNWITYDRARHILAVNQVFGLVFMLSTMWMRIRLYRASLVGANPIFAKYARNAPIHIIDKLSGALIDIIAADDIFWNTCFVDCGSKAVGALLTTLSKFGAMEKKLDTDLVSMCSRLHSLAQTLEW